MKLQIRQRSDADFISSIDRTVRRWDRWRLLLSIGGLLLFGWAFWYLYTTWEIVSNTDVDDPLMLDKLNKTWMLISLFAGVTLGMNFYGWLSFMVKSIVGGYRTERLLLKLHAKLDESDNAHNVG